MKNELPQGYTARAANTEDARAVTDLIVACDIEEFGRPGYGIEDLLTMWRRKNFNLATDSHLVLASDGTVAGYMDMFDRGDVAQLNNNSCVHPTHKNHGIEEWMLERAEEWARERVKDRPIVIRHVLNANAPARVERMRRWGYQAVRQAWILHIDLDKPPGTPQVPEGIVVRSFERGRDERDAWMCIQEAFRDLWEHKDVPYDEWASFVLEHKAFSPELSYLAFDGDEIVGTTITLNDELGAWVQQVGVRRPWRGRGIALALLQIVFGELYKRGVPHAGLEVDAENPSGALRVYERAGMRVQEHFTEFRKELDRMNMQLPEGFVLRAPTPDDAQIVTDLIAACDTLDYGEPDLSLEDIRADWRRSGFELERNAWLIFNANRELVAYGNVWDMGAHARVDPSTCVHPKVRERGLEDFHIARAEQWTRENSDTKIIQWIANSEQASWTKRLEQRGYHTTRHDYVMEIALDVASPAPILTNGFMMRSFERGRDERAVWACLQDAFRDHRGHVDLEFDVWWASYAHHPEWSPELSTVVTQGDEVVAAAMVFHSFAGGWIRSLGVRRPWRKQGIALAMLYHIFSDCYARGIEKVGLGVDAENLTGATRLYERAGMKTKIHFVRYEKEFA